MWTGVLGVNQDCWKGGRQKKKRCILYIMYLAKQSQVVKSITQSYCVVLLSAFFSFLQAELYTGGGAEYYVS
jgi:hypothetical protein